MNDRTANTQNISADEEAVRSKTGVSASDFTSGAATGDEQVTASRFFGGSFPGGIGILIFSLLLIVGGIIIAIITSMTVFGIVIGLIMVIAGVAIPFLGIGRKLG